MKDNRKIILWGAGIKGVKILYRLQRDGQSVECFVDSRLEGEIHGIPIRKDLMGIKNLKDYYIVVSTGEDVYPEIREILLQMGLSEFDDFIWGDLYGKLKVVINANCYGQALMRLLLKSRQFQQRYGVYPIPSVHENRKGYIDDIVLAHADVCIYQDIRENNPYSDKLSCKFVLSRLKEGCKKICIPNLVGMGYGFFPTQIEQLYRHKINKKNRIFYELYYRDSLIDEAVSVTGAASVNDIIQYIENYKFDENEIKQKFCKMMETIRSREKGWDIKVADYIEKNYQHMQMMIDIWHPSCTLMQEIGRQVAELLEIDDFDEIDGYDIRDDIGFEAPIWTGVKQTLGLVYPEKKEMRIGTDEILGNDRSLDTREYIQEYIWCFHNLIVS